MKNPLNRREFLQLAGSAGLGLTLSQFPFRRLAQVDPIEPRLTAYEEVFKTTACGLCPAGCSMRARLVNGNLVGVSGNPMDPFTGGGLCAKGLSIGQQLYHTDRLSKPLQRIGVPGKESWKVVEWDEALKSISAELHKIAVNTPQRIVFLNGRPFGFMKLLIEQWMKYLGSLNHIADHYLNAFPIAARLMMGKPFFPACEMSKLDLLVSVGDSFLDYSISPVYQAHQYAEFRQDQQERRGRLIVFDDTKGITAEKADRFYRIEPGSHGAILLALAKVIFPYELYDKDFVDDHTTGLEEWNEQALQGYTPEDIELITGVPADVIYQVAAGLAHAEHKLVLSGSAAMTGVGGLHTAMAMLALNALLGSVDRDLRLETSVEHLLESPLPANPSISQERRIDHRIFPLASQVPWIIPDIIQAEPEAVAALFLYYSNPLASHPGAKRW